MTAIKRIEEVGQEAKSSLAEADTAEQLEEWRRRFLGRKGEIPLLLRGLKDLPEKERASAGHLGNELRRQLEQAYREKKEALSANGAADRDQSAASDDRSTSPIPPLGHYHPITQTLRRIQDIFSRMGFLVVEGPEVEEARYNFDLLNIPLEHPARAETDTFYLEKEGLVLRTHTSPVQVRAVLDYDLTPPFRILSPGRVFRAERTDTTHETTFHQFEGLVVSRDVTIAEFKGTVEAFYAEFFEQGVTARLRPSYFPFVEPGFEVDLGCVFCDGKGCRVCKQTGWLEMMGAGMVHPNVLRNMNVDPEEWQGYAFGGAVDRLAMLRHNIDDIRLFWSGDLRFLTQF